MDVALGIGADDIGTGIAIDLGADATEIATEIATDTGTQIGTVPGDLSLMGSDGVGWMGSCGKWPLEAALPGAGPDLRPDSLYGSIARRFSYSSPHPPEPVRTRP